MTDRVRDTRPRRLAEHLRRLGAVLEGPLLRSEPDGTGGSRRVVADDHQPYRVVVPAGGQTAHGSFAAVARIDGDQAVRLELPDEIEPGVRRGADVEKRRPVMLHLAELAREDPDRYPGLLPVSATFAAILPVDGWDSDLRGQRVVCDVAPWCTTFKALLPDDNPNPNGLAPVEAVRLLLPVLRTWHALHEDFGYIHRDLCEENLLLDPGGRLRTGDPGAVAVVPDGTGNYHSTVLTKAKLLPPEVRGAPDPVHAPHGPAMDAWQLGRLLYLALTGDPQPRADSKTRLTVVDLTQGWTRFGDIRDDRLRATVRAMLHTDPKQRQLGKRIEELETWLATATATDGRTAPPLDWPVAPRYRVQQPQSVEPDRHAEPVAADSPPSPVGGPDDRPDHLNDQARASVGGADRARPSRRGRLRRWAPILGGARRSILDQVPQESDRFTDMLPLLVAVAMVSGISMAFAIATGVLPGEPAAWFAAVPVALLWMALIFLVDRALTSSMKSTRSVGRLLAVFIPRILIAAVIGAVVSGPLVLQIFSRDIRQEMLNDNLTQGAQQSEQLDEGPEKQRLDRATEELNNLQAQAATGKIAGQESAGSQATIDARARVATLEGPVAAQREVYQKAQAIYTCSVDSSAPFVDGCVRDAGISLPRFLEDRERAAADLAALEEQLSDARKTLAESEEADALAAAPEAGPNRESAKARLPAAEAEYESALAAYTAKSQAISSTNAAAVGIIAQIRALERLQSRDAMVRTLHWLVAALFFLIELMPVIVKTFRSWGDPNPYELAETAATTSATARRRYEQAVLDDQLAHDRQRLMDRLQHQLEDERRHREARAAATMEVELDMLDREVSIGKEQNVRVAARMEGVVARALDEWEREVDLLLAETPAPLASPTDITYGQAGRVTGG